MERRSHVSADTLRVRAAGVGSAAVGFTTARWPWHGAELLSFLLIGAGVFLAGEAEDISRLLWKRPVKRARKTKETPDSADLSGSTAATKREARDEGRGKEERPRRPLVARGLAEIALVIASGFAVCCVAPPQHGGEDLWTKVIEIVRGWQPGQPGPMPPVAGPVVPQGPVTLQLDPALQAAVMAYLTKPAAAQGSAAGGMSGVELVLLLLIAGALIALLLKKPKEAAVVGAAALSAAAIKEADHLSRMEMFSYWTVTGAYVLVSVVALVWLMSLMQSRMKLAGEAARARNAGGDGQATALVTHTEAAAEDKRKKTKEAGDPLLAAVVSVVILLWTVVVVGYRGEETKQQPEPPVQPPVTTTSMIEMLPTTLAATVRFGQGEPKTLDAGEHAAAELAETARLREDLERLGAPGDELLLLGSADCTSYKANDAGNDALARRRAEKVSASVKATAERKGIFVQPAALTQHRACRNSPDQRTVFPILLKPAMAK